MSVCRSEGECRVQVQVQYSPDTRRENGRPRRVSPRDDAHVHGGTADQLLVVHSMTLCETDESEEAARRYRLGKVLPTSSTG